MKPKFETSSDNRLDRNVAAIVESEREYVIQIFVAGALLGILSLDPAKKRPSDERIKSDGVPKRNDGLGLQLQPLNRSVDREVD